MTKNSHRHTHAVPANPDGPEDPTTKLRAARRVLVFGGTFDPPHLAHVTLPFEVADAIDADLVAYIPAAVSPFKQGKQQTPAQHRLAMLRLALADRNEAVVLTDELDRSASGQPSYMVDTLRALKDRLPESTTLRLLIGGDQLRLFDQWRDYQRIIDLAEPAVMVRPPDTRASLLEALPDCFDRAKWADRLIETHTMNLSATAIRSLAGAKQSIADLVPTAVARYIRENDLYKGI